ncbi:MAG: nitroreductase [Chitinophagaceae bacterium]|nr:MAG: nitroreductase [Chitinophagaceae bacterium]
MNPESFNELARNRRSTFPDQFAEGSPVDDAIVQEIVTNALWAPNHGKAEPWHFTIFSGEGLKTLSTWQSELYKETTPDNFKEATYLKLQKQPLQASHVIALCMKKTPNKNIPEWEDLAAMGAAVQNIYLGVTAYGLGGYWTSGGVTSREKAKEYFNLGPDDKLMGFFLLGHVAIPSTGAKRQPFDEKVTWVRS